MCDYSEENGTNKGGIKEINFLGVIDSREHEDDEENHWKIYVFLFLWKKNNHFITAIIPFANETHEF
jgi:hypothetical protein